MINMKSEHRERRKQYISAFDQEKTSSLAAQKERYTQRHETILAKLAKCSEENEKLKKKLSLTEKERDFLDNENKSLRFLPAVHSSLKGVQLEPMDLRKNTDGDPLPNVYLEKLNKLRKAGGLQKVYSPSKYAPTDNT